MSRIWVVLGDITSSGGRVISGSSFTDIDGEPVARVNDQATCPQHKGIFPIVDGDATTIIDGQPVALHGSKLACGCSVLAIQQQRVLLDHVGLDHRGGAVSGASFGRPAQRTAAAGGLRYDEAFLIRAADGKPQVNRRYRVLREDGAIEHGTTDSAGMTHLLRSSRSEVLSIEVAEEGP